MISEMMTVPDVCRLSFTRLRGGIVATGLTVTVAVINQNTGATLLASTALAETVSGNGRYLYLWTHGLVTKTWCEATYSVGGVVTAIEKFTVNDNDTGVEIT